jgi:Phage related hypothetical protein (DUF1799)
VAQLRALGAPASVIEGAESDTAPATDDCLVWEENWLAVSVFVGLRTQWRLHVGMGGAIYQGLDYMAVEAALRLQRVPRRDWPALFDDLQVMEAAALPLLNDDS